MKFETYCYFNKYYLPYSNVSNLSKESIAAKVIETLSSFLKVNIDLDEINLKVIAEVESIIKKPSSPTKLLVTT